MKTKGFKILWFLHFPKIRDVTPGPFLILIIKTTAIPCSFPFTANKHHFPHYASNPLFSARPERLTTSLFCWGKITWLCCVQVPRSLLTPVVRPANVSHLHLQKWFLPPTGSSKPWFRTERKLLLCYIKPSCRGIPTHSHQRRLKNNGKHRENRATSRKQAWSCKKL